MKFEIGSRIGRWTVISDEFKIKSGSKNRLAYTCKCECGTVRNVLKQRLVNGQSCSCGCLNREKLKKHLESIPKGYGKTRLHRIWGAIKYRCSPKYNRGKYYYFNGIRCCKEWEDSFLSFRKWSLENGYRDDLTIDRIDSEKGYEPNNCRWVTMTVQNRNKKGLNFIDYNGESHVASEWAEILGTTKGAILYRNKHGMDLEDYEGCVRLQYKSFKERQGSFV